MRTEDSPRGLRALFSDAQINLLRRALEGLAGDQLESGAVREDATDLRLKIDRLAPRPPLSDAQRARIDRVLGGAR